MPKLWNDIASSVSSLWREMLLKARDGNSDVNKATQYKTKVTAKAVGCKAKPKNFGLKAKAKTEA